MGRMKMADTPESLSVAHFDLLSPEWQSRAKTVACGHALSRGSPRHDRPDLRVNFEKHQPLVLLVTDLNLSAESLVS
jgi:hypothetical protein